MDALEFIKEWNRMLKIEGKAPCIELCTTRTPEETVSMVEEWSSIHPCKTRQSEFLKQYPNARIDSWNVLRVCPADIYGDDVCLNDVACCSDCCRDFWSQEVE